MAEQEKTTVPEKKKTPIALIIVLVVLGLVLAGGISFFVTTKLMATSNGAGAQKYHDPGVFIKLGDSKEGIIANVGGIKGGRFLKISIVLEMNPGKKDNLIEGHLTPMADTKVLDTTLKLLRAEDLENYDVSKQDILKDKLRDELNRVLGEGSVYAVYITHFVLQ